ncbi:MAG: sigma-70 family RNA polymerase sigma factor [Vicinamibacteraceae bacterium]
MSEKEPGDVTRLLQALGVGDPATPDVLPLVYDELRRLAAHYLRRERRDHTLQPTALVHEAYLRLAAQDRVQWRNRAHFMGVAAQLMRRVLVDHARANHAQKRGGHDTRVSIDDVDPGSDAPSADIFALDEALTRLAGLDPRQARIVELRYFGGLTVEEVGELMTLSTATIKREWQMARAWIHRELQSAP